VKLGGVKTLPCGRPGPSKKQAAPTPVGASDWRARLDAYLLAKGLKQSQQRIQIAETILEAASVETVAHYGIQDIVRLVQKRFPGVGTATVYRNIKILCEALVLRETLTDADDRMVYEPYEDEHHDHIVCLDCKAIFEFHDAKIESLQDQTTEALSFEAVRHRHVIYAKCQYAR
jgi:Fur family ferric uptake transcriptional regulator